MRTASFWQTDFNSSISTAFKCKMKMLSSGMVLNMSRTTNEKDEQCAVSKFTILWNQQQTLIWSMFTAGTMKIKYDDIC